MIWVWFMIASDQKTRLARVVGWFVPWVAMNMVVTFTLGMDLLFTGLSLLCCGWFWYLGYVRTARHNVRVLAQTIASYTGEHPELAEFDLKRGMKAFAAKR